VCLNAVDTVLDLQCKKTVITWQSSVVYIKLERHQILTEKFKISTEDF